MSVVAPFSTPGSNFTGTMKLRPATGLPSAVVGFSSMPLASDSAAAPKPWPLGDSETTAQFCKAPASLAEQRICTAPAMPACAAWAG